MEKILCYGEIGERVSTDTIYNKYGKGNYRFLQDLAGDIGISYSELCRAIQFFDKFGIVSPDSEGWNEFSEGKNISWNKIKTQYLPENPREEKPKCKCPKCGHTHTA